MHVDIQPWEETVEIDAERWVALEFCRRWPRYAVDWTVRQKHGDGDFPVARGSVDAMPPGKGGSVDEVWDGLRVEALGRARESVVVAGGGEESQPGLFRRLFRRQE